MGRIPHWLLRLVACAMAGAAGLAATPGPATPREAPGRLGAFIDRFMDGYYAFHTVQATRDGVHQFDDKVAGYSPEEIKAEVERLKAAQAALKDFQPAGLDSSGRVDYLILDSQIQAQILDLETTRRWEKDPGYYVELISGGVHSLAVRPFAPAGERLKAVIAREKAAGTVLAAALTNLLAPPRIRVEAAIEATQGTIAYLRDDLPRAFVEVAEPGLKLEFETANRQAILDLQGYLDYLRRDLLPTSAADFRLGPQALEKKLLYEEMCDVPLFRLERMGEETLKRLHLEVKATAAAVDPDKQPQDLFRILSIDYPETRRLLATATTVLDSLRGFCLRRKVVTLPDMEPCRVALTPPFVPAAPPAWVDLPGPFEKQGRQACLYLTPPDSSWAPLTQDDQMRQFNRHVLPIVGAGLGYPGLLVQDGRNTRSRSRLAAAFRAASTTEGWRFYCQQMVLDQGYGGTDPRLRLFQLKLDLLEACRFLVAIRMHTAGMTTAQAVDFLVTEGFQERITAEREVRRLACDPMGLAAFLGKLEIDKLRDDYRLRQGPRFDPRDFHDRLLSHGTPPLKLLRQILLPGDKGSLL